MFFYVLIISFSTVFGFNIEQRIPILKYGPDGSLFGLSVAQHHITKGNTNPNNAVILVGAPTANRTESQNVDVRKPGALFSCKISTVEDCSRLSIMPTASIRPMDSSNQWLGVSVKSQKPGGKIVVCAHRYTIRGGATPAGAWEAAIGRCFMLENTLRPVADRLSFEYFPCLGMQDDKGKYTHETFGYCQAGIAVDFSDVTTPTKVDEYVTFGAPGSLFWSGAFYNSMLNPDILDVNVNLWSRQELSDQSPINKNSLLGSSLASGKLISGDSINYLAGAPGMNFTGAVAIFEKAVEGSEEILKLIEIIVGEGIASRFGQEVQLVDVTGDGRLDLIIGAPQYYDRKKNHGGAVYIYVNKGLDQIGPEPTQTLYGNVDSSFGISITHLGDINMDGADDIAIGAPGEDSWKGAVYIYNGDNGPDSKGVLETPSQVLKAEDFQVPSRNITGLGYSLSGGLDMDFNGYPDLAAGSLSDSVVIFQARPVVNVAGRISTSRKRIVISEDPEEMKLNITICLNYSALPPSFDEYVEVNCTVKLDTERLDDPDLLPRVSFSTTDALVATQSIQMTLFPQSRNKNKCKKLTAYLKKEIQDKLSPIEMELSFNTTNVLPKRKRRQATITPLVPTPVMNAAITNMATTKISFAKECGRDDVCKSSLSLAAYYQVFRDETWSDLKKNGEGIPVLKLGTEKQVGMVIDVENPPPGEDAHQATLDIQLPDVFEYRSIEKLSGSASDPHCDTTNETFVKCSLANPFKAGRDLQFRLKLSKNKSIYQATNFTVKLQLHTTSQQPGHDEIREFLVIVQVEAQLKIVGYPSKPQIRFGGAVVGESAVKQPADAGTVHTHSYEVTNTGTGPAEKVKIEIMWPQNIINGKWLFYLLDASVRNDGGNCTLPETVNPLKLKYTTTSRKRRDTANDGEPPTPKQTAKAAESSYKELNCSSATCIKFECLLGTINRANVRYIDLHAVLWNSTFLEEYNGVNLIQVQSAARVTIDQKNVKFSNLSKLDFTVATDVLSEVLIPPKQEVKWWIIVVASAAGVVLLVCLVLILWKCGFFKRQKFGDYQKARRHKQASRKADDRETLY